jgi:membrane protein implicated in regulation of membrane protease activity
MLYSIKSLIFPNGRYTFVTVGTAFLAVNTLLMLCFVISLKKICKVSALNTMNILAPLSWKLQMLQAMILSVNNTVQNRYHRRLRNFTPTISIFVADIWAKI